MGKSKKPWFGKRWTKSFIGWIDSLLFCRRDGVEFVSVASSFCINFTIGLVGGFCLVPLALIADQDAVTPPVLAVTAAASLLSSGWYLYKTVGYFNSVWVSIARCLYVIVINFVACGAGFMAGMWGTLLAIMALICWAALSLMAGGSSKGPRVRLNDGTELKVERGMCGEEYYTSTDGREYERVGDSSFREK